LDLDGFFWINDPSYGIRILDLALGEVGWGNVDWIGLAKDRKRWRALVEFGIEPSGSMKCWETIEWPNI
jgi:hypothetical protein